MENIRIAQIDKSDFKVLDDALNFNLYNFFDLSKLNGGLGKFIAELSPDKTIFPFGIRFRGNAFKENLIGTAIIYHIDWIARTGELFFFIIDEDNKKSAANNNYTTIEALTKVIDVAFKQLNLNKISIEVLANNKIQSVLEVVGFVAEGIRREAIFKNGSFSDTTVCSIFREKTK